MSFAIRESTAWGEDLETSSIQRRGVALGLDPPRWHARRHQEILRAHPQVRSLFGPDRATAIWIVALDVVQVALAWAMHDRPLWVSFLVAFFVGAPIAHALGVLIHECTHNLVFRETWKNKALSLVANLPLAAPAAVEFRHQHLLHHRHLGDAREVQGGDTQAPVASEVRFVGHSGLRKFLSFTFGRFFYKSRLANKVPVDEWYLANIALSVGFSAAVLLAFGWRSLVFLVIAALLAFGPHPLGARRISEHLTVRRGQPTTSYYGIANRISFDVGYHVEHHDFPHIPWSRMRKLHTLVPGEYERLASLRSWTRLIADYFFDSRRHAGQYVGVSDDYIEEEKKR